MGSEQTILKLSFGTTKIAAYPHKIYVRLFVNKNMGLFTALMLFI